MVEMDNYTVQIIHPDEGNNPATSIGKTCASLFAKGELVDCTLSCSDGHLKVHRVVLASVSTYMYNMLTSTPLPSPCSHPILFLRNSTLADVRCAMQFIYSGETQTTKNRLPALLEISQELGCVSLRKAIESCIHACGIEAFKRRMNNTPAKSPLANNNRQTEEVTRNSDLGQCEIVGKKNSSSLVDYTTSEEHNNGPVVIKEEVFAYDDDDDGDFHAHHHHQEGGSGVNNKSVSYENEASVRLENDCSSAYNNSSNNTSQSDKSIERRREHHKRHGSQSPMGESPEIKKSRGVDLISNSNKFRANQTNEGVGDVGVGGGGSDDNSLSSLNFQNEKGESFVYTNDDFEMKSSPKFDQEEEDYENCCYESSGEGGTPEHETELVPPITQKPIISMNDLKDFMKADIKDDDNSNNTNTGVPSSCPWCIQVFTSLSLLQKHIRTHVNNYKPFTCDQCHNTFARSAHLKRHMRTHTGEKPYQCNICQRSFARQDKLKTHLERHLNNAAKANQNMNLNYSSSSGSVNLSQNSTTAQKQIPLGSHTSGKSISKSANGGASKVNINNNNISQKTFNHPNNNNSTHPPAAAVPISMRFGNVISTYNGLSISYSPSEQNPNSSHTRSLAEGGLVVSSAATIPCNTTTTITPVVQGSIVANNNLTDSTNKRLSPKSSHHPNPSSLLSFYVASS